MLLALIATPAAVKTAEVLPLLGMSGLHRLCLLFPFAMLIQRQSFSLVGHDAEALAQASMYLQFPLYALVVIVVGRFNTMIAGLLTVITVHLVAAAAAWLVVTH